MDLPEGGERSGGGVQCMSAGMFSDGRGEKGGGGGVSKSEKVKLIGGAEWYRIS